MANDSLIAEAEEAQIDSRRARKAANPLKPAHGVIRFQNIPMMNVANSGALKNENSNWM